MDAKIQELYFRISEIKLIITLLYIISDVPKYDIIWTGISDVIDSFISEILKYKFWIPESWRQRSWTMRFTPKKKSILSVYSQRKNDQMRLNGVNLTVQDLLCQNARIQDLYFNISEMKLLITSLYIISDAPKYDIILTENSDVIDSFI